MSRPPEPQKKEELLEKCLNAAIETGSLDCSINVIAKRIGTSGRMLVYHFGSKQELEKQVISLLERRLRDKLWSFQLATDDKTKALIQMWEHFTSKELHGLLKLTMELNQRAVQGDVETRQFLELEIQKWLEALSQLLHDENKALILLHLFQGAVLDYLTTGNVQRGEQTIRNFIKLCYE
ncbi:TetR family transcriptional regulator [Dulcicalothrix desertica PCC 7102]|uniref:TetR family transcriptional regulator n=1 Tax=Dulcicalothrix desertica PCC 7102 TaxID=232991 RepID=A0A433VNM6_9CYAN|nr:TetR/AcrR family transcriptional regulator [Dulcicalothrix desertica]RUT07700.1 TetR family transcriptional regulator [Dulcicalothrix desertica PCC 7102]TWH39871.1 TetR family transcriptional regulator [Dulcicalothrix desertica PCC 7102]